MTTTWKTFSIQLNNLTDEQSKMVEAKLMDVQRQLENEFNTTGGDFIGIDEGTI